MKTNPNADCRLDLTVGRSELVSSVKERVAGLHAIPFPEQELVLNDKVLLDGSKLSACGVYDGAILELAVKASGATLAQQLTDLMQAPEMKEEELNLLYCYKYGAPIVDALKMLGYESKLEDFLKAEKGFLCGGGRVQLVGGDNGEKQASVDDREVPESEASVDSSESDDRVYNVLDLLETRLVLLEQRPDIFGIEGRPAGSLHSARVKPARRKREVCASQTKPIISAEAPPGLGDAPPGLEHTSVAKTTACSADNQQYIDLHSNIASRCFQAEIMEHLDGIVELVIANLCFPVAHHVKGGSVGKGTAINGCSDAQVMFYLKGFPTVTHDKWLQPLLEAIAGMLSEHCSSMRHIESIDVGFDSIQVCTEHLNVDLFFSPVFETYKQTLQVLREQCPDARRFCGAPLALETAQFIARQPAEVKATMRLLKWWRGQQEWSNELARPSDSILELMAVYSAVQTKPKDQRMAIANVMSLLSRFDQMRIVWANKYSKEEVWQPLLKQRPLLMDPCNPFVNVADPQAFDSSELMALARNTYFFW